jgi:Protein of unknown function (DUF2806)
MKKDNLMEDDLRAEYDLKELKVRKLGSERKSFGGTTMRLEADDAEIFPNAGGMSTPLENSEGGILSTVFDSVNEAVMGTSIPAPIRKNAFKAFNQLCTAAIDIPVSYLEGIATEKRAETQAREKIISITADQIAKQIEVDPEYARVAFKKYGEKILREQVNLDKISDTAARQVLQETSTRKTDKNTESTAEITSDWLNCWQKEASQKDSEEMQLLFSRILAGEIQRPNSFSIATVKRLGELDQRAASIFKHFCSLCISLGEGNIIRDARVLALGGNAAMNSLLGYSITFESLNILHESGLIIPDFNSYMDYQFSIVINKQVVVSPFTYQKRKFGLLPSYDRPNNQELRLHGVALSRSGQELLKIVDIEPSENYTFALQDYFRQMKLEMIEISES